MLVQEGESIVPIPHKERSEVYCNVPAQPHKLLLPLASAAKGVSAS